MLACAVSCLVYASTSLLNSDLSFCVKRSLACSSLLIWRSRRLTASSMRGFKGGGGLTTVLIVSVNVFSSLCDSHFLAKRSDKSDSSEAQTVQNLLMYC